MKITAVKLKKIIDDSYSIVIERGILKHMPELLKRYPASRYVIVTDTTTKKLYGDELNKRLASAGLEVVLIPMADGERSKNRATKEMIESAMLRAKCDRKTLILALGGGVVGDVAGFVAATYMRGISYIQVPTTMLAMVDSSIGGKVGIDTKEGKNTIGAFYQPRAVFIDPDCLRTVPSHMLTTGVVEAVKMFMTSDKKGFDQFSKRVGHVLKRDIDFLEAVIRRAAYIKAQAVSHDEKESGSRMILNFGHTIGHALEKLSNYTLPHGHAVALGILLETRVSGMLGYLSQKDEERIVSMINALGIDRAPLKKYSPKAILQAAKTDKKSLKGKPRYILLSGLGKAFTKDGYAHEVSDKLISQALLASRN